MFVQQGTMQTVVDGIPTAKLILSYSSNENAWMWTTCITHSTSHISLQ